MSDFARRLAKEPARLDCLAPFVRVARNRRRLNSTGGGTEENHRQYQFFEPSYLRC
jgi:hypothetical protein